MASFNACVSAFWASTQKVDAPRGTQRNHPSGTETPTGVAQPRVVERMAHGCHSATCDFFRSASFGERLAGKTPSGCRVIWRGSVTVATAHGHGSIAIQASGRGLRTSPVWVISFVVVVVAEACKNGQPAAGSDEASGGHRDAFARGNHDVVEDAHADVLEGFCQLPRDNAVRRTGFGFPAGMTMCKHYRARVVQEA